MTPSYYVTDKMATIADFRQGLVKVAEHFI